MTPESFIQDLYGNAVDRKDVEHLSTFLSDDVQFRIGNHDTVVGKSSVLEANRSFFNSIASMSHQIDNTWSHEENIICNGSVHYIRLDGSTHSATFSTILRVQQGKIADYLVYADLSQL